MGTGRCGAKSGPPQKRVISATVRGLCRRSPKGKILGRPKEGVDKDGTQVGGMMAVSMQQARRCSPRHPSRSFQRPGNGTVSRDERIVGHDTVRQVLRSVASGKHRVSIDAPWPIGWMLRAQGRHVRRVAQTPLMLVADAHGCAVWHGYGRVAASSGLRNDCGLPSDRSTCYFKEREHRLTPFRQGPCLHFGS